MTDELLTVAQAARYLKGCDKTVRRLIQSNQLPASRISSRSLRIRRSDIDHYVDNHKNDEKGVPTE